MTDRESTEQMRERLLADPQVQEMIRHRAFYLYQQRAGRPGTAADDWFQAESEVVKFWIEKESGASAGAVAEETPASIEEPAAQTSVEETPAVAASEAKPKARKAAAKPATPRKSKKEESDEEKVAAPKKASPKKATSKKSGETKSKSKKSKSSQPEAEA